MGFLRRLLIAIVALAGVLVAVAYLLPRHAVVERSIVLDAPPEEVFAQVNSLQAFSEWSPWNDHDPQMVVSFSGPETGVGNAMEWSSDHPQVGNGRQVITETVENEFVRTAIDFGDMGTSDAWWRLSGEAGGTRLTWGLDADMGMNPVGRWMGLMMDRLVGADYERGLARLRDRVEG